MQIFNKQIIRIAFPILIGVSLLIVPLTIWASTNHVQNSGLEAPFVKYGEWTGGGVTFDLEVAQNWEKFFVDSGTEDNGNDLRYFKSSAVEFLFGFVEKRDGADAQLYWSTSPYDAGIYQQVSGLNVGEAYGFQIGMLQVYGNTTSQTDNKMFRSVGIDPTGGIDPTSANVIWSPEDGHDVDWFYPGVGAQAISSTMTVFVRVRSLEDAPALEENSVWVDDAFMDVAPTTTLTLSPASATQVTANWSGTPRTGFHLFTYEAQYRKSSESTWTDLQIFDSASSPNTATGKSFNVEIGVEYVVRARTWHEDDGGDSHEVPGPWVEQTIIVGGVVAGKVLDNQGNAMGGATVSVSTAPTTNTVSSGDGAYQLHTGVGAFSLTAGNGSGWSIPYPISATVPNLQTIIPLTLTLRPPDDVISNGDFENGLTNWQSSGNTPTTNTSQVRSVSQSLQLSGTVSISQTGLISNSNSPGLSFWYKLGKGDGDDTFTAEILGPGLTVSNSFNTSTIGNWQHVWLPLNQTDTYTGPVGVRFSLSQSASPSQTIVYLDEVSLGSTQAASSIFLPIVLKE